MFDFRITKYKFIKKIKKKEQQTSEFTIAAYPDDKSFQGTGRSKAVDDLLRWVKGY